MTGVPATRDSVPPVSVVKSVNVVTPKHGGLRDSHNPKPVFEHVRAGNTATEGPSLSEGLANYKPNVGAPKDRAP